MKYIAHSTTRMRYRTFGFINPFLWYPR
jgi:hypothetical protein